MPSRPPRLKPPDIAPAALLADVFPAPPEAAALKLNRPGAAAAPPDGAVDELDTAPALLPKLKPPVAPPVTPIGFDAAAALAVVKLEPNTNKSAAGLAVSIFGAGGAGVLPNAPKPPAALPPVVEALLVALPAVKLKPPVPAAGLLLAAPNIPPGAGLADDESTAGLVAAVKLNGAAAGADVTVGATGLVGAVKLKPPPAAVLLLPAPDELTPLLPVLKLNIDLPPLAPLPVVVVDAPAGTDDEPPKPPLALGGALNSAGVLLTLASAPAVVTAPPKMPLPADDDAKLGCELVTSGTLPSDALAPNTKLDCEFVVVEAADGLTALNLKPPVGTAGGAAPLALSLPCVFKDAGVVPKPNTAGFGAAALLVSDLMFVSPEILSSPPLTPLEGATLLVSLSDVADDDDSDDDDGVGVLKAN